MNDIIVEFNGQPVQDAQDLIAKVAGTAIGQTVSITYLRDVDGKLEKRSISVALGERPDFSVRDEALPGKRSQRVLRRQRRGSVSLWAS